MKKTMYLCCFISLLPLYGQTVVRHHPLKDVVEIQRQGLLPEIESIEEDLKSLTTVSDAVVYDYNEDDPFWAGNEYRVQVFLKNGDVLEFSGVTEGLEFSSTNSGGIHRINDMSFFLHGVFGLINSGISSKYLSLAIAQEESKRGVHTRKTLKLTNRKKQEYLAKYKDISGILQDYDKIRHFLLDTPYGTNCGAFHSVLQKCTQVFGRVSLYDWAIIVLDENSVNNNWKCDFYRINGSWFGREKRDW